MQVAVGDTVLLDGHEARVVATSGTDRQLIVQLRDTGHLTRWMSEDRVVSVTATGAAEEDCRARGCV